MRVRSLLFSAVLLHNNCSLAVRLEDAAHNSNVVVGVGDHECQNQNDSDSAIATNKHSQNEEDAEQAETTDDNDNTTSNDQDEYDYQFLTSNHDVVSTEVPGLKICFKDDVQLKVYFEATRSIKILRPLQAILGRPVVGPVDIMEDNEPVTRIVNSVNTTPRVRHHNAYANIAHDDMVHGFSAPKKVPTSLQMADIGTKPLARPARTFHHYNMIGYHNYPSEGTEHYKLLQLDLVGKSFRNGIDVGDIPK